MTVEDTAPDLIPPIPPEEPKDGKRSGLRPRERRILQILALVCLVPTLLSLQWLDETRGIEKGLKPPEKVVTARRDAVADFLGARWKALKYETAQPLAGGPDQGEVTELRVWVGVRPDTPEAAKTVGSYGLVFRFADDDGHRWSAAGTTTVGNPPRAGSASLISVRGTVPRSKAESLELEIQQPKESRKQGRPLLWLRFER